MGDWKKWLRKREKIERRGEQKHREKDGKREIPEERKIAVDGDGEHTSKENRRRTSGTGKCEKREGRHNQGEHDRVKTPGGEKKSLFVILFKPLISLFFFIVVKLRWNLTLLNCSIPL